MCENFEILYTYKWKKRLQNIVYFDSNMKLKKKIYIYIKKECFGEVWFGERHSYRHFKMLLKDI